MTQVKTARLTVLFHSLTAAAGIIRELDQNGALVRLAAEDKERWEPVMDALSAGMEQGPGTVQGCIAVLSGALEV